MQLIPTQKGSLLGFLRCLHILSRNTNYNIIVYEKTNSIDLIEDYWIVKKEDLRDFERFIVIKTNET